MDKCKKCGNKYHPARTFLFNKRMVQHLKIGDKTKELVDEMDDKIVCQECLNIIREQICIDDYTIRRVEHLEYKRASVPFVTTLMG